MFEERLPITGPPLFDELQFEPGTGSEQGFDIGFGNGIGNGTTEHHSSATPLILIVSTCTGATATCPWNWASSALHCARTVVTLASLTWP